MSQTLPLSRIVAAVSVTCLAATPAFAQSLAVIERATQNAIGKLDLQLEIPGDLEPSWLDLNLPALSFSEWILWIALAIGIGIALYAARDDWPRLLFGSSKRWSAMEEAETGIAAGDTPAGAALNADEFANRGLYKEAMHLLLLRAIAELRQKLGTDFARSLTSREILRRANLPEATKAPL